MQTEGRQLDEGTQFRKPVEATVMELSRLQVEVQG